MSSAGKRVHLILRGKGGVGKTLVASLLAQYLLEAGGPVRCYDTDPVNNSFAAITALGAKPVDLLDGKQINSLEIDRLVNEWIAGDGDVIVDNGAAGFVPLSKYLIENFRQRQNNAANSRRAQSGEGVVSPSVTAATQKPA